MKNWIAKNKVLFGVLLGLVIVGLLVVIGVVGVNSYTLGIRNEGERQEQDLTALSNEARISLSTCLDQGTIAAQVTKEEYKTIKEILVETTSARYVDASGKPTDASGVLGGGKLISALQENYPQVDQRDWQNLQTLVVGCRDEFQGSQDHIQAAAAAYNKWRVSDDILNQGIKSQFPSNQLVVVKPDGTKLHGQDAYDYITTPISTADANKAFESGVLDPQDLFGK